MLTCANSCTVLHPTLCCTDLTVHTVKSLSGLWSALWPAGFPPNHLLHVHREISSFHLSSLTSNISVPSPAPSCSELIIAPPPPWPFSSCESSTPQQPSTTVVAAFITPKQPNVHRDNDLQKPNQEMPSIISTFKTEKLPLARPEPEPDFDDIIFESFNQSQESGGLFLEEEDSKRDTIKRCPPR